MDSDGSPKRPVQCNAYDIPCILLYMVLATSLKKAFGGARPVGGVPQGRKWNCLSLAKTV